MSIIYGLLNYVLNELLKSRYQYFEWIIKKNIYQYINTKKWLLTFKMSILKSNYKKININILNKLLKNRISVF